MKELGDSLGAFCADLKAQGNFNRVMVMTFSEFGRRVAAKRQRRDGPRRGGTALHARRWREARVCTASIRA